MPKVTISFDATFESQEELEIDTLTGVEAWISSCANVSNACLDYDGNVLGELYFPSSSIEIKIDD